MLTENTIVISSGSLYNYWFLHKSNESPKPAINERLVHSFYFCKMIEEIIEENDISTSINYKNLSNNGKTRLRHQQKRWADAVKARDNYTCQCCKCVPSSTRIHAHHIFSFGQYPTLREEVNNGISLCSNCHIKFHDVYGKCFNDDKELIIFIKNNKNNVYEQKYKTYSSSSEQYLYSIACCSPNNE